MNRIKLKKYIRLALILIAGIVFINTCMMTNIPDELTIMYETETITAYNAHANYVKYEIIPEETLNIRFDPNIYREGNNKDDLYIRGNLFVEKPYDTLRIKEISYNYNGKNHVIIKNDKIDLSELYDERDFIVDENNEPIMINGKKLFAIWLHFGYLKYDNKVKFNFEPKYLGMEKEIELIQIYSINGIDYHEEKYKYKVICGGKKFDIGRPMKSLLFFIFPP